MICWAMLKYPGFDFWGLESAVCLGIAVFSRVGCKQRGVEMTVPLFRRAKTTGIHETPQARGLQDLD